ncbi:hypothetical protein BELL_0277g00010 [Botrytis elliptica]|uniref:Uncharacterized protein n=1 Tax=Botrytis elliptica TaxID=278938 RepID=A0A4Z1JTG7_9HELO|nr:hypothetical protein BELL_0277g00010 [Botrytis elliptica]
MKTTCDLLQALTAFRDNVYSESLTLPSSIPSDPNIIIHIHPILKSQNAKSFSTIATTPPKTSLPSHLTTSLASSDSSNELSILKPPPPTSSTTSKSSATFLSPSLRSDKQSISKSSPRFYPFSPDNLRIFLSQLEELYPEICHLSDKFADLFGKNDMKEIATILGEVHYQLSLEFDILSKDHLHLLRNIESLPRWKSLDPYNDDLLLAEADANEYLFTGGTSDLQADKAESGSSDTQRTKVTSIDSDIPADRIENWTVTSLSQSSHGMGCIAFSDIKEVYFGSNDDDTILSSELVVLLCLIIRQIDPSMGSENVGLRIRDSELNGWIGRLAFGIFFTNSHFRVIEIHLDRGEFDDELKPINLHIHIREKKIKGKKTMGKTIGKKAVSKKAVGKNIVRRQAKSIVE